MNENDILLYCDCGNELNNHPIAKQKLQEYIELVKDIQRQLNINQHMVEQDNLILMNTAINGLINLASLA